MFHDQEIECREWLTLPELPTAVRLDIARRILEVMREWDLEPSLRRATERAIERESLLLSLEASGATSLDHRLRGRLILALKSLYASLDLACEGRAGEESRILAQRLREERFPAPSDLDRASRAELRDLVEGLPAGPLAVLGFEPLLARIDLLCHAWVRSAEEGGGLEPLVRQGEEALRWIVASILVRFGGRSEENRVIRDLLLGPVRHWQRETEARPSVIEPRGHPRRRGA